MDKRTLLAVVLSVVVITVGSTIQLLFFAPSVPEEVQTTSSQTGSTLEQPAQATPESPAASQSQAANQAMVQTGNYIAVGEDPLDLQPIVYSDDSTFRVTIDKRGATLTSFELLQHKEKDGNPVDLVRADGSSLPGLASKFGGWDGQLIDEPFYSSTGSTPGEFRFYRDFAPANDPERTFRFTKIYSFKPGEYMFELRVQVESLSVSSALPPINQGDKSYTLFFGPQIGPEPMGSTAAPMQQSADFRRFTTRANNKNSDFSRANPGQPEIISDRVSWAAIAGKYFSFVAIPGAAENQTVFAAERSQNGETGTQLAFERAAITSANQTDTYRFYAGPMRSQDLARYNRAQDNAYGIRDLKLDQLVQSNILSWLETVLKAGLQLFYWVIPNWGVAIILLTILVKFVFYPLTKKSHQSTKKMQLVQPKMQELREKLKDNPQKMNAAIAELYKKEGVNPLGGCLPMLIQFPFFIAMYGLFNNHFDLRGAEFIPGWISDLSAPDAVLSFGFEVPILGWTDLHILPFLYLASQLLYGKVAQQPQAGAQAGAAKMMMYALPIVFFFVLYNVPSGLLVYWIVQNLVTMGQQVWVNRHMQVQKDGVAKK